MPLLIRRSNLLVDLRDEEAVANAWRHEADAITLDLEGLAPDAKALAPTRIRDAIAQCARGAAEVFVKVQDASLTADLEAAIWPGLRGIVLPRVESAADVADAAETVTVLERERGIRVGSLEFIVLLESAAGVW